MMGNRPLVICPPSTQSKTFFMTTHGIGHKAWPSLSCILQPLLTGQTYLCPSWKDLNGLMLRASLSTRKSSQSSGSLILQQHRCTSESGTFALNAVPFFFFRCRKVAFFLGF